MHYHTILLDADGTLLDFDAAQRSAFFTAMEEMEIEADTALLSQYDRINHLQWQRLERGEVSRPAMLVERFAILFAEAGIQKDAAEANRRYAEALSCSPQMFDGTLELLEILASMATLAIITNGVAASQRRRLALSGIDHYCKALVISEEIGHEKPSPQFFEKALSLCECQDIEGVLVVGDSLTADIAGANAAGLDCCWYNPKQLPNTSGAAPTYEIAHFDELLSLVLAETVSHE